MAINAVLSGDQNVAAELEVAYSFYNQTTSAAEESHTTSKILIANGHLGWTKTKNADGDIVTLLIKNGTADSIVITSNMWNPGEGAVWTEANMDLVITALENIIQNV